MSNINFKDYLDGQLKDLVFKKEFENETTKLESVITLTRVKEESGLSQRDLATIPDVPQSTIARIGSGANTGINTLAKIVNALGKRLIASLSQWLI